MQNIARTFIALAALVNGADQERNVRQRVPRGSMARYSPLPTYEDRASSEPSILAARRLLCGWPAGAWRYTVFSCTPCPRGRGHRKETASALRRCVLCFSKCWNNGMAGLWRAFLQTSVLQCAPRASLRTVTQ
ncbi:hypothetical protein OH76DRAFT_34907 [Lentinus brumalis]|uniref:Uncharacterized protein n=1 Tax=Lentinus brumalis TaxID=2498619 RepID=A0A371DY03_9APHY|nr:hypothetical protein OH76DRAFT_34907 [Polyporus brumalis]